MESAVSRVLAENMVEQARVLATQKEPKMETWKSLLLVVVITFLFGVLPFMWISRKGKEHEAEENEQKTKPEDPVRIGKNDKSGKGKRAA
jgi:flagellar basal body-associated protein FliL